jgi:hypothetical protein
MINLNEQLDKVIQAQLGRIMPMLNNLPDGEQKDYIVNAMKNLKDNRTLDASEFIEGFAKLKGEEVDIEKLRETVKKNK